MAKIKGPAIFLAQFLRDEPPHNNLENIGKWAANLGYKGLQIPSWDSRVFDLDKAAESKTYCDEYNGKLKDMGLAVTELYAIQGQLLAMHEVYASMFAGFYPEGLTDQKQRTEWASDQLKKVIKASVNMGTKVVPTMSGGFAWILVYPWPQRPAGLIDESFKELAKRWKPLLDMAADNGIAFGYELHPGSDVFDGATFERFLETVDGSPAACINYDPSHFVLQQLDYLGFIDRYKDRIKAFHVKDAEFQPRADCGVYGGYLSWEGRAGRFRSLGDGDVDFSKVFTKMTEIGYDSWAVLEWECAIKSSEQGAAEGAPFIEKHLIEKTEVAFDDFVGGKSDVKQNRRILGLE
jgi:sugar phosphate isomerase/epimerase